MHKIVIPDTSCLIVLDKIKKLFLLQELYTEVIATPEIASAIALGVELKDRSIILDDLKARKIADDLKLNYTGTLGIKVKRQGIIAVIKAHHLRIKKSSIKIFRRSRKRDILSGTRTMIKIYTDGAAQGNPGRGGYGTIMKYGSHEKELSQGFRLTTNNRMELMAVIIGLESIRKEGIPVTIYSDSKYVVDSVEKGWIWSWEKKNFKDKANVDLWKRYIPLHKKFKPKFVWVKGHAGHIENERCDVLAVAAAEGGGLLIDKEYELGKG